MSKTVLRSLSVALALCLATPAVAEEMGTAAEAQALVKKALAHFKTAGKDKACADFAAAGDFQSKDLYVFVQEIDGIMLCHGKNPALNGKNLAGLKDSDGRAFVAQFIDTVKSKGSGWVDYKWVNASTKKIEPKSSYVEKGDGNIFIGAGIYKP
ncbi:cache domain-containing protein [Magnetospirillum sulfuroxidans]|uniref:Cache domain-containing protein n=1 Tax=Magnetospirillum sulfuroxidans TaxID=611300 RepID=A0ABS5IFT9_9PROT|nr:cache domain-containing protein [Magnetospirillum sulfuroxidans]MBR9973285.1 cache domain-containing protein [Magnetospirillum sulfuroxidans]